jgi:hypothetical protein
VLNILRKVAGLAVTVLLHSLLLVLELGKLAVLVQVVALKLLDPLVVFKALLLEEF